MPTRLLVVCLAALAWLAPVAPAQNKPAFISEQVLDTSFGRVAGQIPLRGRIAAGTEVAD